MRSTHEHLNYIQIKYFVRTGVYNMKQRYSVNRYSKQPHCKIMTKGTKVLEVTQYIMKWIDRWQQCPEEVSSGFI